ncbi:hypothetical protein NRA33_09965 [Acinetobacter baumannii]|nr:hypothetical protein [Acinetobacter baumannii]MDC5322994.1 hypothetical protein [Acinetobacter baumannii]
MDVKFDLIINTDDYAVDMKTGLESMQGISDTFRLIGEALLTDDVADRKTHRNDVRTNLERNFKGSYGQIFSLEPHKKEAILALRKMGKETFVALVDYFLAEALYQEPLELDEKAQEVLESLSKKTVQQLMTKLRNPLINIHKVNRAFGYTVNVRYRKYGDNPQLIQTFDANTLEALNAVESNENVEIKAAITRINIHTGNGRIQLKDKKTTIAFGFGKVFSTLPSEIKKIFSTNLDHNMGINQTQWQYLNLIVSPVKLGDGTIVKYVFKEFSE